MTRMWPFFIIVFLGPFLTHSLDFPVSFAVVRNIVTPISVDRFLEQIGCCQNDSKGNPINYSIVSLDGFQALSTPATLQAGVTPLSIWLKAFQKIGALKPGKGSSTSQLQQYLLSYLHSNRVKLMMNVFADEAPVSDKKVDALVVAQNIISIMSSGQLDGVSVEFTDYHSVAAGTASQWLSALLSTLRGGLKNKEIVLIIPATIVNRVPLFQQPQISGLVDLFVLKYYGFSKPDYTDFNSLFNASASYPGTAFAELLQSQTVAINLCRTLIAKPPNPKLAGFVAASTLAAAFDSAYTAFGWFGGYANLDFEADYSSSFQVQVLAKLRSNCQNFHNCFCP